MPDRSKDYGDYIEYIESCFRNYPEALAYYEPLKEHLDIGNARKSSSLQQVHIYDVAPSSIFQGYPRLSPFTEGDWNIPQKGPRVAVVEGFPSPHNISLLGAKFLIRPEFFIGNLTLTRKRIPTGDHYELPTLPSMQANLIRVRFSSPLRALNDGTSQTSNQISRQRSDLERAFSKYDQGLSSDKRYGQTRFRRINLHDSRTYSTEQALSMTIAQHGDHWTAIFLTDQGRSLGASQGLPWSYDRFTDRPVGTISLVPYNLPVDGSGRRPPNQQRLTSSSATSRESQRHGADLDQFHPLRRIALQDEVDSELLEKDPFFLLANILTTSLLSWSQLLNILSETIAECQSQLELSPEELEYDLNQLRYHMQIVHRTKEQLSESLKLVERRGCPTWPKASSAAAIKRKESIKTQLEADYRHIIDRCSLLIRQCESSTTVLVGFAQLRTAERGSEQASEVHNLTRLATFFIPLSFSASIFGMNIREWQPPLTIGWFLGTALVLTSATFAVLFQKKLGDFYKSCCLRCFRR